MIVKLKNVRLSFPALFEKRSFGDDPDDEGSYSAAFILDEEEHEELLEDIENAIDKVAKEKWGKKIPRNLKKCLRDGVEKEGTDGYGEGFYFITARNSKKVPIVDRSVVVITADNPEAPYAGCYVNATVRLWAQDNKYGKRVNAQLRAVQFKAHGDPFGEAPVNPDDEFDVEEGGDGGLL